MIEREIREELMAIAEDIASYEFFEIEEFDRRRLESAPIQDIYRDTVNYINADVRGFYQEEYNERLEKVEKALKDLWLIA